MIYQIRDDIIHVDAYYQAEVHYKRYLEQLYDAGYYCFQAQWARLHKNPKILKGMRDAGLVAVDAWSGKYNIVRLTQTALKYLTYRDAPADKFEGVSKDQIPVRTIAVRPNNGPLLASAMRYEIIVRHMAASQVDRMQSLSRGYGLQYVDRVYLDKIARRPGAADYLQDDYQALCQLILTLHDSSKVLVYDKGEAIHAVVLDVAHRDPASYEARLTRLETLLARVCNMSQIKRIVVTVSEARGKAFGSKYNTLLIPELAPVYAGKVTTDKWVKPRDRKLATAIADRVRL